MNGLLIKPTLRTFSKKNRRIGIYVKHEIKNKEGRNGKHALYLAGLCSYECDQLKKGL